MYTKEQILVAIDTYNRVRSQRKTIQLLGYPSAKVTLAKWVNSYKETGNIKHCFKKRKPSYTNEQIEYAVQYYLEHGRNITQTCNNIGYPCRNILSRWVSEKVPNHSLPKLKNKPLKRYSYNDKIVGAINLEMRNTSATEVEKSTGVSRTSLYKWRKQLLSQEALTMNKKASKVSKPKIEDLENRVVELQKQIHQLQLEKDALEAANKLLKKAKGVNIRNLKNCEKAIIIDALRNKYCLKEILSLFNLSKSSFFYQNKALQNIDKYKNVRQEITDAFYNSGNTYGYRRLHAILKRHSITVSEKVVRRIMKEENLFIRKVKIKKYSSYKGEISPAVPNIINRDFHSQLPNQKWLTDITEFQIPAGKVYLSSIIDCFDGMPVSWTIGTSPNAELVNTMLDMAIATLPADAHPIVHSDRGSHYRWPGWINRMEKHGLVRSMSKKGCSPDNAACEAFFGRLKNEMFYNHNWINVDIDEFIDKVDEYIRWYSTGRIKMSLGAMSPLEYRRSKGLAS